MRQKKQIIFFDGVCNLCNRSVDFLMKLDSRKTLMFSSLQGETAKKLLNSGYTNDLNTIVFLDNDKVYTMSDAIIRALIKLGSFYRLLAIFLIIPKFIRDFIYQLVAKNRYKLFGKKNTCRLPSLEEKDRFLE